MKNHNTYEELIEVIAAIVTIGMAIGIVFT